MSLFSEIRAKRLFQIVAAFAAAGWIGLEILGSLIERGILPEILYRIALLWYIAGIAASLVVGWYHGEKGRQKASIPEIVLLSIIGVSAVIVSGLFLSTHIMAIRVANAQAVGGLDLSRVAVLYFDDRSSGESEGYLGDALTESLIANLDQVDALQVMSPNAVLPFRGTDARADSVGRLLEVGTVIDGVVEERGGTVRIAVELLDGNSGFPLARTALERPKDEVLQAMDEVAEEVGRLFRERLGEEVRLRTLTTGTENAGAWRAVQLAEKLRKDAASLAQHGDASAGPLYERADSLLQVAEVRSPEWPEPTVLRARLAVERVQQVHDRSAREAFVRDGIAHADRALAMDPENARALAARGTLRLFAHLAHLARDGQEHASLLREAREDLERAVRLDRSLAPAHATLSVLYYQPGVADLHAAALAARAAYEADAYLTTADAVLERLFWTNLDTGQFSQARRWCLEGARRFPTDVRFQMCQLWQMTSPGSRPNIEEAWQIRDRIRELVTEDRAPLEEARARMLMAGILGRAAEAAPDQETRTLMADSARAVLQRVSRDYEALDDPRRTLKGVEAFAWVILDDFDRAIDSWKVYAALNHGFQDSGDISWRWRELRDHPRFQEVTTQHATH